MVLVALITAADGVCHPTPAALIISRQRRHSIYPHCGHADRERTNERKQWWEMEKSGQNSRQRFIWSRAGGDSAGVSQLDAGRSWVAAAAALLFIHGVAAGMRRESQRRLGLWDVRYTGGGRLERRVERWAAQWRNVCPNWL